VESILKDIDPKDPIHLSLAARYQAGAVDAIISNDKALSLKIPIPDLP
jgi:hypothetical protein